MSVSVRRATTPAETARSLEIYNTVWPSEAVTPEEVAAFYASVDAYADFLASVDGEDAGSAVAAVVPTRPVTCFALVTVLPEARRRGAGSALYAAVSEWAATHELVDVETRAAGDDEDSIAFARRRGFHEHSREAGLELDLRAATSPPRVAPPPGIEITTLAARPDAGSAVYDVAVEADPDVPGYEDFVPQPRETWLEHHLVEPQTPPEAIFLALAGDEVVGYAKLRLDPHLASATHAMTGVKRAWRGRGVASALKAAQIAWATERGLERLTTTNELRNAPMRRVNERFGYRPVPGRVHLRGPLARP